MLCCSGQIWKRKADAGGLTRLAYEQFPLSRFQPGDSPLNPCSSRPGLGPTEIRQRWAFVTNSTRTHQQISLFYEDIF